MDTLQLLLDNPGLAKTALTALDQILAHEVPDRRYGLCYNLGALVRDAGIILRGNGSAEFVAELAKNWPYHSGDAGYPVQHPEKDAYHAYYSVDDLWTGEYGKRRLELTRWVRDRLAEMIAEHKEAANGQA